MPCIKNYFIVFLHKIILWRRLVLVFWLSEFVWWGLAMVFSAVDQVSIAPASISLKDEGLNPSRPRYAKINKKNK